MQITIQYKIVDQDITKNIVKTPLILTASEKNLPEDLIVHSQRRDRWRTIAETHYLRDFYDFVSCMADFLGEACERGKPRLVKKGV